MTRLRLILATVAVVTATPAFAWQGTKPPEDEAARELAKLQGTWEFKILVRDRFIRSVKRVKGNKTIVTRYDDNGNVLGEHTSVFKLDLTGRVKIFTFSNVKPTAGRNQGNVHQPPRSYVYTVDDDTWVEVRGLIKDEPPEAQTRYVWKRVREDAVPPPPEDRISFSAERDRQP